MKTFVGKWVAILAMMTFAQVALAADAKPKDCEVCIRILSDVENDFKAAEKENKKLDKMTTIEKLIDEKCAGAKSQTDKKVCYYILPIKRKVSQPMSNYAPADRVCKKLKKESPELCAVREAVKVEKGKTDYNALRIRDLKKILMDRGVTCNNCLEKAEFVKKCEETEDLAHDEL